MFNKIRSYLKFGKDKPAYHVQGSAYGGLRIDIDKYYQVEENQDKLKKINNSAFGQMFDSTGNIKDKQKETATIK